MAMSLSQTIAQFAKQVQADAEKVVVKVALDLHAKIVMRSPVLTGRFKANNQIAVGSLPQDAVVAIDPGGSGTISSGQSVMGTFKMGDTIWLYNNVAYALELEFGRSQQAPQGVYRISMQEITSALESHMRSA